MYSVYMLMNSRHTTMYIGVTGDLNGRIFEHKNKLIKGLTSRYNVNKLVYFEDYEDHQSAINREEVLKGLLRNKKIDLIKSRNPKMRDLAEFWYV